MSMSNKTGRLAVLLVRFGVSPAVRHKDPKVISADLKSNYLRRAKEEHPDLVPPARRKLAEEQFIKLKADFEEASQLIEGGWASVPFGAPQSTQSSSSSGRPAASGDYRGAAYRPRQDFNKSYQAAPKQQEFDILTRIKGITLLCSGTLLFLYFMREFLVFSAGSTYSWTKPENFNPFWVRRFKDEWGNEVAQSRTDTKAKVERQKSGLMSDTEKAVKKVKEKKDRDIDNFYVKRGISNTRKKSYPRGMEPTGVGYEKKSTSVAEVSASTDIPASALASRHHPEIATGHPNEAPAAAPKPGGTSTIKARRSESSSAPPCELQAAS